jgi:hypothetical protein
MLYWKSPAGLTCNNFIRTTILADNEVPRHAQVGAWRLDHPHRRRLPQQCRNQGRSCAGTETGPEPVFQACHIDDVGRVRHAATQTARSPALSKQVQPSSSGNRQQCFARFIALQGLSRTLLQALQLAELLIAPLTGTVETLTAWQFSVYGRSSLSVGLWTKTHRRQQQPRIITSVI